MLAFLSKEYWKKGEILLLAGIILFGLAVFGYRISTDNLDYHGDYQSYIETARLFNGEPGARVAPQRMLKPLEPFVNAVAARFIGYQAGFLFQVGIFYALLVLAAYIFFKKFFIGSVRLAAHAVTLFSVTYPMLRYGLDAYTETGAWFFYVLGLIGCWYILEKPTWKAIAANLVIAVLGFFWKEYSIVPILILHIIVLFHPALKGDLKRKASYLIAFDAVFGLVNLLWQLYVYVRFDYNYIQWYLEGGASNFAEHYGPMLIGKSFFSLLMIGWIFVLWSWPAVRSLDWRRKLFLGCITFMPLIFLAWGAISSRLFYVILPALAILCVFGIERLFTRQYMRILAVCFIVASHAAWLVISLYAR